MNFCLSAANFEQQFWKQRDKNVKDIQGYTCHIADK